MRRYDIVSGILLILSIIDFALAAPVLAQEKHQARVDVEHIPRDVTTVLGRRLEDPEEVIERLAELFKSSGKPVDSPGAHTLSSSAPSPSSSTANPDLLEESTASSYGGALSDPKSWYDVKDGWHEPMHTPMSTDDDYGPYYELAGEPASSPRPSTDGDYGPYHELAGEPASSPRPSTDGNYGPYHELAGEPAPGSKPSTDGDYGPYHELAGEPALNTRPSTDGDYGPYHELAGEPASSPRPSTDGDYGPYHELAGEPASSPKLSTDGDYGPYYELVGAPPPKLKPSENPYYDWSEINLEEPPPPKRPKLASSKEFGQTDEGQARQVQLPSLTSNPTERSPDPEEFQLISAARNPVNNL